MKTSRRSFIKLSMAAIIGTALAAIPKSAQSDDEFSGVQPSPGRRPAFKREIICRDYTQDYGIGDQIQYKDLISAQDCSKCTFKGSCVSSGTRFAKHTSQPNKPRTYYPELFRQYNLNEFVR